MGGEEDTQEDRLALEETMKSGLAWSPGRKLAWSLWSPERDGLYLWKSPGESRGTKASRHGAGNCSLGNMATMAHNPWNGFPGEE